MAWLAWCHCVCSWFYLRAQKINCCKLALYCNIILHLSTKQSETMTTQNLTIGQLVTFSNAFGVNVITEIKGNTATTLEKNTGFLYKKRLTSLKPYVQQKAYWNEQELAQPIHKHGDVVFTTLSSDGNGGRMVWDDIKKDCVDPNKLTHHNKK